MALRSQGEKNITYSFLSVDVLLFKFQFPICPFKYFFRFSVTSIYYFKFIKALKINQI